MYLTQVFFFRPRQKNSKLWQKKSELKQKTQGFGKFWCNLRQKSTEMTQKQGGTTKIKDETFITIRNGCKKAWFSDQTWMAQKFMRVNHLPAISLSTACPERSNFCVPSINRGCLLSLFLSVNFTKAKKYFVLKIRNTKLVQDPSNLNYVQPMIWLKSLPFNDPLISFKIKWLVMTFLRPRIALLLVFRLKYVHGIWQTLKNCWNNFFSEQQLALRIGNFMIHVFLWQGC